MQKVKIFIHQNFFEEKQYIIDTFFHNFFNILFEIHFHEEKKYIIYIDEKKISFDDTFFSKEKEYPTYLSEKNIPNKIILAKNKFTTEIDIPVIFGNENIEISKTEIYCGIDIFASSFFMLTRWEEFAIKTRDKYNRFPDEISLAQKHNFHKRPIVNEYFEMLRNMFTYLGFDIPKNKNFSVKLTHDIDFFSKIGTPYKLARTFVADIVKRKSMKVAFQTLKSYFKILQKKQKDIYNMYDFFMEESDKNNIKSHFYFIPGKLFEEDIDYNITNKKVNKLINHILKKKHKIGIHGSYRAYNKDEVYSKEISRLRKMNFEITEGRQHFLRFENPKTWQIQSNNGIKYDSTIGFSNDVGFRAGTCFEYPIFDILKREKLNLIEQPLIAMETHLIENLQDIDLVVEKMIEIKEITKKYNGIFVILWHNSNFSFPNREKAIEAYRYLLKNIVK